MNRPAGNQKGLGLVLLCIGACPLVFLFAVIAVPGKNSPLDFKSSYLSAQCLLTSCDPYDVATITRMYEGMHSAAFDDPLRFKPAAVVHLYPPSEYVAVLPYAKLPWDSAAALWCASTALGLFGVAFLMWKNSCGFSEGMAGALTGFVLANSLHVVKVGNPSGIATALLVLGVCCVVRNKYARIGVLSVALSLAVKPQLGGLLWIFFLFAGPAMRRRAWQIAAASAAIILPMVFWVSRVSPHWFSEVQANIHLISAPGAILNPGVASALSFGPGAQMIDLKVLFAYFQDSPAFYNPASFILFTPALVGWIYVARRSPVSLRTAWFALASLASLSLLPVYHRQYDAKLLLLTIPACAWIWSERQRLRYAVLVVEWVSLVLSGELFWIILRYLLGAFHLQPGKALEQIVLILEMVVTPLALLTLGALFCWYLYRYPEVPPANAPEQVTAST